MHPKLGAAEQSFWLVTEPRHFGGRQWYFRCPRTDRRVSVLWKSPGDDRFLSWQACGRRSPTAPNSRPGTTRRARSAGSAPPSWRIGALRIQWQASPPSQEDALADVRTRSRANRRPRKRPQSLSGGSVYGRGVIFGGIGGGKTCRSGSGAGVVTAAGGLGWSCSSSH
jgi:hypothetical protein